MAERLFVPNPRQEQVLAFKGNLAVLAGAGSGKTGTLIELLIRLLAGEISGLPKPLAVDKLLALTFAEKAAAEMRGRLRREIESRLAQAADPAQRHWWLAAYHQLDRSDIGTIHGFALKLLRRKALAAGISARLDPQGDPWILERLKIDLLLDYLAQSQPELNELLFWLPLQGRTGRGESLLGWLESMVERQGSFGLGFQIEDAATELDGELENLKADLAELGHLLAGPAIKEDAAYRPALEEIRAYLELELAGLPEAAAGLERAPKWLAAVEKSGRWYNKKAQLLKKNFCRGLESLCAKRAARLINPLKYKTARLGTQFYQDLEERLGRQGQLTFDAILLKTRKLLARNPRLRAELAASYPVILVDEFQDTNQVQADVLAYLALPPEDSQIYPEDYPAWSKLDKGANRLIIFGDPKQSIYRFRGAEPGLMTSFLKKAVAENPAPDSPPPARLVALNRNYRSQAGLLDFYNVFFESYLGPEQFGGHDIQIPDRPRLYPGAQAVWLPWKTGGRLAGPGRLAELGLLVSYLKQLLSPASRIRVGQAGRLPRPSDITILLKRFTHVAQYAAALRKAGLPVRVVRGFGPLETEAVRAVIAAYAYLAGLDRELNLLAVLRSSLAGISDQAIMRLAYGPAGRLSDYFTEPEPAWPSCLTAGETDALEDLKRLLSEVKPLIFSLEPARAMSLLVERSGLKALAGTEDSGPAKISALERFLSLARCLPQNAAGGPLTAAEYFLDRLKRPPEREEEPPQEDEAAITIMTIHQSKGLGFPIVVVPETGARRNGRLGGLIFGENGQLAIRLNDPVTKSALCPGDYHELKALEAEKDLNDYKRLLYVAATRAKDHLVFLGPQPKDRPADENSWNAALAKLAESRPDLLAPLSLEASLNLQPDFGAPPPPREANRDWIGPVYNRLKGRQAIKPRAFQLSATSLALALSCPAAYYYQEVLGLEPLFETPPANEAAPAAEPALSPDQKGRIFHSLLETWPLGPQASAQTPVELMETALRSTCERLQLRPAPEEERYLKDRALEFWRQPCGRELLAAAANGLFVDRECPLWLDIEAGPYKYSLTGVMDLYYQAQPGHWRILDYKLALPKQIGRYARQLEIYALALRKALAKEDVLTAGLYFAGSSPADFIEVPLPPPERMVREMEALGGWLAALASGDFSPPAIDPACQERECPFRKRCFPESAGPWERPPGPLENLA